MNPRAAIALLEAINAAAETDGTAGAHQRAIRRQLVRLWQQQQSEERRVELTCPTCGGPFYVREPGDYTHRCGERLQVTAGAEPARLTATRWRERDDAENPL